MMNKKMARKLSSLCALVLMIALIMTGCSSEKSEYSVKIAVAAPRILESGQTAFDEELRSGLPELETAEKKMLIQYVNTGDVSVDAMTAMAGMNKIMMMFTAGEIEIMICDPDNAFRHGENGAAYLSLDKLFSEEEQQELGIQPLTIAMQDDLGNLTGKESAACGIDLSENELLRTAFKMSNLGLYVIDDGANENLDSIRTVIKYILAN